MSCSVCNEELLYSIASFSPPLSPKSGTPELPHNTDAINIEVATTPETTTEIKPSSSTTPIVNTHLTTSTPKTRHSPTPPHKCLQLTIDHATYTVPTMKKSNIFEDPVFLDSGLLHPILNPVKQPSQSNTMTDELQCTHPIFEANLSSFYMNPTTYKFRFPQDSNFDHYVAYASKNLEQLSFYHND